MSTMIMHKDERNHPMKRRELSYLVSGLIIGVILGILLQEAVLGGTAGTKSKAINYYLLELGAAEEWLVRTYPEDGEKVQTSLEAVLPTESVLPTGPSFPLVAEDVEFLLLQTYAALVGEEDTANVKVKEDSETSLCLALDDNPYAGSMAYLYLTVPAGEAKNLDIPQDWEKLNKPRDKELFWQLVACFPDESN
jgi:hypothetical protein